nr:unnamed protein product [Callosobruchus chinensis]
MFRCDWWAEARIQVQLELRAVVNECNFMFLLLKKRLSWRILNRMVGEIISQKGKDERMHRQQNRNSCKTEDPGVPTLNPYSPTVDGRVGEKDEDQG